MPSPFRVVDRHTAGESPGRHAAGRFSVTAQNRHRIEPGSAARRDPAGEHGHGSEHEWHGEEGERVARTHAEEQTAQSAGDEKGESDAVPPARASTRPCRVTQSGDTAGLGAERETQGELARPPGGDPRHDPYVPTVPSRIEATGNRPSRVMAERGREIDAARRCSIVRTSLSGASGASRATAERTASIARPAPSDRSTTMPLDSGNPGPPACASGT